MKPPALVAQASNGLIPEPTFTGLAVGRRKDLELGPYL